MERFRENADVKAFDCGNKELNDFLTTREVVNYERERLGKTYLVYWQATGELVAYFTISNDGLRLDYLHSVKSFSIPGEIRTPVIPGILIGRLAVDTRFKRRGVGSSILLYIAGLAEETAAAARIIFLEAYPESVPFYESFNFETIEHQKFKQRRNKLMVFDLMNHPERK